MSNADPIAQQQDDTEVLDLFGILRRRKGFVILGTLLGLMAAGLYLTLTPPTYRAEMEILVGQKSADLVKGANAQASVEGVDADEDVLSTHIQLMTSRRIIKAAVENHHLANVPSIATAIDEGIPVVAYITNQLYVTKGGSGVAKDAHILRATYDDPSNEDCALILRAIFDEYKSYLSEHFNSTSSQAIEMLTNMANDTAEDVRKAEKALTERLGSSRLMWDGQKATNIHKTRLEKIEEDLLDLTETEAEITSRLAIISDFVENTDPEAVSDFDRLALLSEKEVARLKILFDVTRGGTISEAFQAQQPIRQETARAEMQDYKDLVMKEKKLLENFSDDHPSVISVREQIVTLRKFIDENASKLKDGATVEQMDAAEMLETYIGLLKNDLSGLKRQREVLVQRSNDELAQAKELEREEMEAESLRLELVRQQDLYKSMNDTLSELNFVRDYAGFSTDVIGDAEVQEKPAWPNPIIIMPLGVIAGMVLGTILGLVIDLCDTTFSDPEDVQRTLGLPVLAHVHRFAPLKRKRSDPPFAVDPTIYAFHRPRSPEAELYRVVRTSLLMAAKKEDHRIIQVTSPLPGDGKSTTSVNLAVAFAQTGKKILIIDADLRKPRLARLLKLDHEIGLSDVLLGEADPSEAITETAVSNLHAVAAGHIPSNPAELLESDEFGDTLQAWRDEYDYVIVDSPPVLAVSDASIISEKCETTLVTMRILKNGRRIAMRALSLLRQHGANVTGIVVNGYQASSKTYGYMDKYDVSSYGYGYGAAGGYYRDADKPGKPEAPKETRRMVSAHG